MPIADEIKTVLLSLVTSGAACAAFIWLAKDLISARLKNAIEHEYATKLETHKAQLTSENTITLERLKSQLQAAALERQIQFSAVYAKREELLGKLHKELTETLDACWEATKPDATRITPELQQKISRMHALMNDSALYFPEEFCTRWHERTFELHRTLELFLTARRTETANWQRDLDEGKRRFDEHLAAFNAMRGELRNEIRKWLGTAQQQPRDHIHSTTSQTHQTS